MASLATDAALGHRGLIGVGIGAVVFADAGVVAGGAHGVPVHAAPGPVAPLARLAVFVAEDIEPVVRARIVGQLGGLPAPAARGNEKLAQRIQADHAVGEEGLRVATEAGGDEFETASGRAGGGGLGAVRDHARWLEGGAVKGGIDGAFGEGVVGIFPTVERGRVAFTATGRVGVGGERLGFGRDERRGGRGRWTGVARSLRPGLKVAKREEGAGEGDEDHQDGEPRAAARTDGRSGLT